MVAISNAIDGHNRSGHIAMSPSSSKPRSEYGDGGEWKSCEDDVRGTGFARTQTLTANRQRAHSQANAMLLSRLNIIGIVSASFSGYWSLFVVELRTGQARF